MKKLLFLAAALIIGFVSCTDDKETEIVEVNYQISKRLSPEAKARIVDQGAYFVSDNNGNSEHDSYQAAATASIDYYFGTNGTPPNYPGDVSNPDNPYDFVGEFHIEILDYVISAPSGTFNNGNNLNYNAYFNYINSRAIQAGIPLYSGTVNSLKQSVENAKSQVINSNYQLSNLVSGQSSANLTLQTYFQVLENSQSTQTFINYSINEEMSIINSQQYSQNEKAYLLGNMATARYEVNYWGI